MTIGIGLGHLVRANGAACACGVFDHDRGRTQRRADGLGQIARHAVGWAASGEGDNDGDGFVLDWKVRSKGRRGGGDQPECQQLQLHHVCSIGDSIKIVVES